MEEWEDELQADLTECIDKYTSKGLTIRQVLGVMETLKSELLPQIIIVDENEEE